MNKLWYVYILSNKKNWTLYVGVTSDLIKRIYEHKNKTIPWFSSQYWLDKLVYYEECWDIKNAIAREKQLKWWNRKNKLQLIENINPQWRDLSEWRK